MLASEGFVIAHGLEPGDQRAGGDQRPPAPADDRRRRAVARVHLQHPARRAGARRQALRHLLDGRAGAGGRLRHGRRLQRRRARRWRPARRPTKSIARLDRLLEPYGGLGAIPRALQLSHWTVENELAQLQSFGFMLPLVFLLVAAFILNVALTRALALQRPQIAALKALGYANARDRLALPEVGAGHRRSSAWCIGIAGGAWLGNADHRALQQVLPLSGAAVQRAGPAWSSARRRLTLVAAGAGAFVGGAARGARAAGRSDAARSAGALPAQRCSRRRSSRGIWAPPGAWCCAT